ncbi:hypothetical protein [Rhodoplanes sp. SY1]|uniref:hypothetical protein n=1 Tax=Rhodoplanes sp. SY1 TaxID=3166646 RepID=UPI0038B64763
MRYWVGAVFFAAAAAFLVSAILHKRGVLAARAAAAARGIVPAQPGIRSVAAFGEILRPVLLFFLAYAAVKSVVLYFMLGGEEELSYFDLAGIVAVLGCYGMFLSHRITYRTSDLALAEAAASAPEPAAPVEDGTAGAARLPAYVAAPANDPGPPASDRPPARGAG